MTGLWAPWIHEPRQRYFPNSSRHPNSRTGQTLGGLVRLRRSFLIAVIASALTEGGSALVVPNHLNIEIVQGVCKGPGHEHEFRAEDKPLQGVFAKIHGAMERSHKTGIDGRTAVPLS